MDVIYWLIPISIFVLFLAIAVFFWAVKNDQFKDLDSPAIDILFEEEEVSSQDATNNEDLDSKSADSVPKKRC